MRVALYSDLHNEHGQPFVPPPDLEADLVILAGDIGAKVKGVKWAGQTFGQAFGPGRTLYVPGNHEYYGASLGLLDELRRTGKKAGVTVLNNEVAVFEDVRIWAPPSGPISCSTALSGCQRFSTRCAMRSMTSR